MIIFKQKITLNHFGQLVNCFSNKHAKGDVDILLIENNKILLDNCKVAKSFNILDLFEWPDEPKFNILDEMDIIINNFRSHLSIVKLKQKFSFERNFAFKTATEEFIKNIVNDLSR